MAQQESYVTSVSDIDTYARDNGRPEWLALSDDQKLRAMIEATEDVVAHHKQVPLDDTLWLFDNDKLIKAATIQAIYIGVVQGFRDIAESANSLADGNYSDGTLSMSHGAPRQLTKKAKFLVDDVILEILEFGNFNLERDIRSGHWNRA